MKLLDVHKCSSGMEIHYVSILIEILNPPMWLLLISPLKSGALRDREWMFYKVSPDNAL